MRRAALSSRPSVPRCGSQFPSSPLRQIVTEGCPDHVVVRLGPNAGAVRWETAGAGPGVLDQVGIRQTPLHAALVPLVQLMPEANRRFLDDPDVTGAARTIRRVVPVDGNPFCRAAAIVGGHVGIPANGVQCDTGRGGGGNRRGQGRCRNGRRLGYRDGCIALIACAPGIFEAPVRVKLKLGRGVELDPRESLRIADQREAAIGSSRSVGKLRGAISADAVSGYGLHPDLHLMAEGKEGAGAETAADRGARERAETAHRGWRRRSAGPGERLGARHGVLRLRADYAARVDAIAEEAD